MSLKLRYFNYALRTWLQVANLDGECREATFFYDGIKPSSNFPENGASKTWTSSGPVEGTLIAIDRFLEDPN